ncbi:SCO family protein [Alkalihalobacillus sp. FSL R5-0424]
MKLLKLSAYSLFVVILSGCSWVYNLESNNEEIDTNNFDISEADLSVPDFEFVDQYGEDFGSKDLEGHFWLADMVFTNCPTVCPIMTPNLLSLQEAVINEGHDISIVSFTVDPENDTVERLAKYTENMGIGNGWNFLTGYTHEEIKKFSVDVFKAPVQKTEDDILHITKFFLMDESGNIIRTYDGMETDQEDILKDLIEVLEN